MKRLFLCLILFFLLLSLSAGPCYEELETISLVTISSRSSIPLIPLDGVSFTADDDRIIPDVITYSDADASTFLLSLNTKPECSFFENALYKLTQNGATMKRTKSMLEERNYREGELVVSGTVKLSASADLDKMNIILTGNMSSVTIDADLDLRILSSGKVYVVKGRLDIDGGSDRIFTITSSSYTVNGIKYDLDLKYRLRKA